MPVDATDGSNRTFRLTILGTTDLHGNVLNWDYFTDTTYSDRDRNAIGLARIATLINAVREERGRCATLTIDAGDTIEGTPLAYYYARLDPITSEPGNSPTHPMAAAMNAIGYDAAALGNHEFNFGLPLLRAFQSQLNHPLLGANVLDWHTRQPAFDEFVLKQLDTGDGLLTVGIVGLVTPGCAIWDKANLDGRLAFEGVVEQAAKVIPRVKQAGADVVVVSCHSGIDTSSSYGDALPWPENASTLLAEQVPDIDAILVGHAHQEIAQRLVTGPDGSKQVLLSEPLKFGMRLTVMDLDLVRGEGGGWKVTSSRATLLDASVAQEDPQIAAIVHAAHEKTRTYVNGVIGSSLQEMSAATARYRVTAAIDFINHVQADAVVKALAGSEWSALPVLSIAAPFNPRAAIPAGRVSVRDVAGLYIYDNTLEAILLTGAQLRAYLECSATYFKKISGTGPFVPSDLTNAVTPTALHGAPDYNYDIAGGLGTSVATSLAYDIDVAADPGSRIRNLTYGGVPPADDQQFVVAINNYRASGGGNFPGVTRAPVVYNAQAEIRQLIIDWVTHAGMIDASRFSGNAWRLVSGGHPISFG